MPVPIVSEVSTRRKSRPKTYVPKVKTRRAYQVQIRPKTARDCAPISYNDLSICYESISSDEACSPVRQPLLVGRKSTPSKPSNADHYSMVSIKSSKFDKLFCTEIDQRNKANQNKTNLFPYNSELYEDETCASSSKQYISIIDFNQLTRTSIDKAVANSRKT